ncbi:hypothetical protein DSO57_1010669 [Entomophthora muscae]|uniref:Uncharacterized protein n=1 Tax=Entomophthora muscae TaxID=34485 RepID=A0ACC2TU26_9FUNG|nr:hypothetical protein DSO57_1010669 [Entomophthora muscae]
MKFSLVSVLVLSGSGFVFENPFVLIGDYIKNQIDQTFNVFSDAPRKLPTPRKFKAVPLEKVSSNLERSLISICPMEKILGIECVCSTRYKDVVVVKNLKMDSMALIAADVINKDIVVAYRPTLTVKNFVVDMDFIKVQMNNAPRDVLVHRGFYRHHISIRDRVFNEVKHLLLTPRYSNYTLHLTGFSLGGAIATISLPDWKHFMKQHNFGNSIESYTYESPRVGNEQFVKFIESMDVPVIRYTFSNDMIPRLPPRALGFTHTGLEYHFDDNHLTQCRQDYDEDSNCALSHKFPILISSHIFPDGKLIPIPPYC